MARATAAAERGDTLEVIATSFSRHLRAEGKSPLTIATYQKAVRSLTAFRSETNQPDDAASISRSDLEDWLNHLRDEKHYAAATLAQMYRSIQQVFKYATSEGDIPHSPVDGLGAPRIPDTPPRVITDAELERLYDATRGTSFTDRRNLAILRLFTSTGMRRSEMAGIKMADLDLDLETVTVIGKGGHTRTVTFGRRATQAIDRYLRSRARHPLAETEPGLWLGKRGTLTADGIAQVVKIVAEEASLPWVHPHLFRHTWAATALGLGLHEQDVSAIAGWRSPIMVTRYGRMARTARAQASHRENNPGDQV